MQGSAVVPIVLRRFASILQQSKATIFEAGSTFIRAIMTSTNTVEKLDSYRLPDQLRVATFCAEPVNAVVHAFAAEQICRRYLNSYWGTEHGGIVWSVPFEDSRGLATDTHTQCLPWVKGTVWDYATDTAASRGDVVISEPYPYLAMTVWGGLEQWQTVQSQWKGDLERWGNYSDQHSALG